MSSLLPVAELSPDMLAIVIVGLIIVVYFAISSFAGIVGYGFEAGIKKMLDRFLPIKEDDDRE